MNDTIIINDKENKITINGTEVNDVYSITWVKSPDSFPELIIKFVSPDLKVIGR